MIALNIWWPVWRGGIVQSLKVKSNKSKARVLWHRGPMHIVMMACGGNEWRTHCYYSYVPASTGSTPCSRGGPRTKSPGRVQEVKVDSSVRCCLASRWKPCSVFLSYVFSLFFFIVTQCVFQLDYTLSISPDIVGLSVSEGASSFHYIRSRDCGPVCTAEDCVLHLAL